MSHRQDSRVLHHHRAPLQSADEQFRHREETVRLEGEAADEVAAVEAEQARVRVDALAEHEIVQPRQVVAQEKTIARHVADAARRMIGRGHHHVGSVLEERDHRGQLARIVRAVAVARGDPVAGGRCEARAQRGPEPAVRRVGEQPDGGPAGETAP